MNAAMPPPETGQPWPADKLSTLRLGRRLVAEVSTATPDLRAFVDITPLPAPGDREAAHGGWTRTDHHRTFRLQHTEYRAERLAGFDYDIDSVLLRDVTVVGETELTTMLETWQLRPDQFLYPWQTDDPR